MDRLDLRLVEYFVAVAEELHFGRAAQRLHIAQPSLSQQIRQLERQLGVTLLERDNRNVRLTSAGATLLHEGRRTLNQARHAIQATRAAGARQLAVGFYGTAATVLLPDVLSAYTARCPAVDVSVRELLLGSIDDVLDGRVAIAFTRLLPGQTELEVEVLATESRLVALASAHPLAARQSLAFAELRDESFIVNPAVPTSGPPARWLAEQQRHGLRGRIVAQASSIQEILALVAAGRGVCLVPSAVMMHHPRAGIAYVPVTDAELAVISLAWAPGPLSPDAEAFLEVARTVAGQVPAAVGSAPIVGKTGRLASLSVAKLEGTNGQDQLRRPDSGRVQGGPRGPARRAQAFPGRADRIELVRWFPETARTIDTYPTVGQACEAFAVAGFRRDALEQVPQTYQSSLAHFLGQADTFRHADTTMRGLTEEEFLRGNERLRRAVQHAQQTATAESRTSWLDLLVLR
jgi:LysR family transcriptional regulator, benzoate and cis,cis-muconate-responsive activator of ben and cat genes